MFGSKSETTSTELSFGNIINFEDCFVSGNVNLARIEGRRREGIRGFKLEKRIQKK